MGFRILLDVICFVMAEDSLFLPLNWTGGYECAEPIVLLL